ncbi:helix-turn-helix transcriptional regulator [Bradyrhizobium iriomotense]|uniref:helix-turn-helix transcriptional regulator n=1 Tax=Bradyrhizobium iriomotense TaxID=441950 RepID=UPI001B89ECD4|nr:AraC family transcriptional regulator [Bradyrhizobium iriomotense]MBR0785290.1 helix-turn-helix transcriptional regulator [Bradyrhizobium iriomotense]
MPPTKAVHVVRQAGPAIGGIVIEADVFRLSAADGGEKWADHFHDVIGSQIMRVQIDVKPGEDFLFNARGRVLPGATLLRQAQKSERIVFRRTRNLINNDDVFLHFVRKGTLQVHQLGHEVLLERGQAVITTQTDIGHGIVGGAGYSQSLRIPRTTIAALGGTIEDRCMRPISWTLPTLRLLTSYCDLIFDMGGALTPETGVSTVARHIQDLVALIAGATGDAAEEAMSRGVPAARLATILTDMRQNAAQPDMSIALVAARHGVSPRYVQMLFADQGLTFSQVLLNERLDRAYAALTDTQSARLVISTIAFNAGFNDLSYFHRAFRRRFGATPGEIREAAGVATP